MLPVVPAISRTTALSLDVEDPRGGQHAVRRYHVDELTEVSGVEPLPT